MSKYTRLDKGLLAGWGADATLGKSPLSTIFSSADFRKVFPILLLGALFANLLALALPLTILQIFDRVVVNRSYETLTLLAVGVITALILEQFIRAVNGRIVEWLGVRYEHQASLLALDRLFHTTLARYQRDEPGVHVERMLAAGKVSDFYSGQVIMVLFDLPFVVLYLAVIGYIAGPLVFVPIFLLMLFSLIAIRFMGFIRQKTEQRQVVSDRRVNFLAELLKGIHTVKAMALEPLLLRRYERLQAGNAEISEELSRANVWANSLGMLFSQTMVVLVVFSGGWLVISGDMTPGTLAASMMLAVRAINPLRSGLRAWMRYQSLLEANRSLAEVSQMPQMVNSHQATVLSVVHQLSLQNVGLRQFNGHTLFDQLTLTVNQGQFIVIQGESGSGKSTLMQLMNGMVQPESGSVLVNGRLITDYNADSIGQQIAWLPQTPTIFNGTLLENITNFDKNKTSLALSLAEQVGLTRIVSGLPLGFSTPLGNSMASTYPTGFRQLITIVRALVAKPSVILFDEANLSLDFESDQMLRTYFESIKGTVMVVMISQRPSWFQMADHLFHLASGKLQTGALPIHNAKVDLDAELHKVIARPEHVSDAYKVICQHLAQKNDLSECLYPLLEALGWQEDLSALGKAMPHMMQSLDVSGFCSIMDNLGYKVRQLPSNAGHIDERLMPCLVLPKSGHAMVVKGYGEDGLIEVMEGQQSKRVAIGKLKGRVFVFMPYEQDIASMGAGEHNWLIDLAWRFRRHLLLIFILTFFTTALALTPPLFVRTMYDAVLPASDYVMASFLLIGVFIALILESMLLTLKGRVLAYLGGRADYILGLSIIDKVISLPIRAIETTTVSRQISRIRSLESLREFFTGPLAVLMFEVPASIILIVAIGVLVPSLLWIVGAIVVFYGLYAFYVMYRAERIVDRSTGSGSTRWDLLNEILTHMQRIRSLGAVKYWFDKYRQLSGKAIFDGYYENRFQAKITAVSSFVGSASGLGALVFAAVLVMQGDSSIGNLMAAMLIFWRLTGPLHNAFIAATTVARSAGSVRQMTNLMRLTSEVKTQVVQRVQTRIEGKIGFSRVSFRYSNDTDPALLGMNLEVSPGELLVISGSNGSGKSSVLKVILKMYVPQAGTVKLDQLDVRQIDPAVLRNSISYMPQECQIYYGTIAQNLRLAYPSASDEDLVWAIEMAGLTEDIQSLPEGLQTRISNTSAEQLAHGFRQRLSLARTMLRPAKIVLMDEPANGMDEVGEYALMRCLSWLHQQQSTVIMVSHRPSHMKMADRVLLMQGGAIVAQGSFEQIKDQLMRG